eukprot:scaffold90721_cov30-Tisochrysis_lutea.AAC.1
MPQPLRMPLTYAQCLVRLCCVHVGVDGGLAPPSLHRGHPPRWARTTNLSHCLKAGTGLGTHQPHPDP